MKKRFFAAVCAALLIAAFAPDARACACCAEPGTYSIWTGKPDEFVAGLLGEMKFGDAAELYTTEAGFDAILGLGDVRKEFESGSWTADAYAFDLVAGFTNKTWRLTLKSPGGRTGSLTLPLPAQMVQFKVDIHDSEDKGLGVRLYKEMRFKGTVRPGTGFLRGTTAPATYFLVFQGRGNGCDNASDFTHWHLEVNGPKTRYEFNGRLAAPPGE